MLDKLVSTNFIRNVRAESYKELVGDMLMHYQKFGVFIKISQLWNKDTRANGLLQCWLITAGHSPRDAPEQLYKRQMKKSKK